MVGVANISYLVVHFEKVYDETKFQNWVGLRSVAGTKEFFYLISSFIRGSRSCHELRNVNCGRQTQCVRLSKLCSGICTIQIPIARASRVHPFSLLHSNWCISFASKKCTNGSSSLEWTIGDILNEFLCTFVQCEWVSLIQHWKQVIWSEIWFSDPYLADLTNCTASFFLRCYSGNWPKVNQY